MPQISAYDQFLSHIPSYIHYNYLLIALSAAQLMIMISVLPSQLLCKQALPIALYNISAQIITIIMPICCIIAVKYNKYYNTVLTYCALTLIAKLVQIVVLIFLWHLGGCTLYVLYRVPVAVYLILESVCLMLSAWILKRYRRADRENKALIVSKTRAFLSD